MTLLPINLDLSAEVLTKVEVVTAKCKPSSEGSCETSAAGDPKGWVSGTGGALNINAIMTLITIWILAQTAALSQTVAAPAEQADLTPVAGRWWTYPADVRRVVIDSTGRPWCELQGTARGKPRPIPELKRQVELAVHWKAPWVAGARILLVDRRQRVWLLPEADRQLLLGYDPKERRWIERAVIPVGERGGYDDRQRNVPSYVFTGPAHESRDGRLYFGDRLGVHVLDDQTWTYQHLYRANLDQSIYFGDIHSFNEPNFAEDEQGRVYVWSCWERFGWTGTLGYFLHDGRQWHQYGAGDSKADRLESVLPLRNGNVLLLSGSGSVRLGAGTMDTNAKQRAIADEIKRLGHEDFRQREAAQQYLAEHGLLALPQLRSSLAGQRDPEVRVRLQEVVALLQARQADGLVTTDGHAIRNARFCGRDREGRFLLWADRIRLCNGAEGRSGFWWISPAVAVTRASPAMSSLNWTPESMLVDRQGRVWFAGSGQGCAIVSGEEPVPVTTPEQRSYRYLLGEDANGRIYLSNERDVAVVHFR